MPYRHLPSWSSFPGTVKGQNSRTKSSCGKRRKDPDPDPDNENGAKHILQTKRRLSIAQNMAI